MEFETFHAKQQFVQPTDPVELGEEQRLRTWPDLVFKVQQGQSSALWAPYHHPSGRGHQPCSTAGGRDHFHACLGQSARWPQTTSTSSLRWPIPFCLKRRREYSLLTFHRWDVPVVPTSQDMLLIVKSAQNLQSRGFVSWAKEAPHCSSSALSTWR